MAKAYQRDIDGYCRRGFDPGFRAEPANAFIIGVFLAALWAQSEARNRDRLDCVCP